MSATNLYTQRLDHLGIVAGVCDEIGLVEIIDQMVPAAPTACKCRQAVKAIKYLLAVWESSRKRDGG